MGGGEGGDSRGLYSSYLLWHFCLFFVCVCISCGPVRVKNLCRYLKPKGCNTGS